MRIGMILDTSRGFPPDIRVDKEARALCAAGFEVGLLCARASLEQPLAEAHECGLEVFRASVPARTWRTRLAGKLAMLVSCPPVQRHWLGPIRAFLQRFRPDVLHCHDLPILPTALRVAEAWGLPVVADLHENMPAAMVALVSGACLRRRLDFALTVEYRRWRHGERRALRRCTRIVVVCPEAARRITDDYGTAPHRVTIVSNTEDETTFDPGQVDPAIVGRYRGQWVASYIGGIAPHRGIDTAIRAAAVAAARIANFRLLIVGVGDEDRPRLRRLARRVGAAEHVELVGWVPSGHVASYLAASRVCLVPHSDFEHTHTTVPHKLFQYMLARRPVVVSSCAPLKRIVEETRAGLAFRANDAQALAECLCRLGDSDGLCAVCGENGRRAALGPYAWRHDAERLVDLYRQLEADLASSETSVPAGARGHRVVARQPSRGLAEGRTQAAGMRP